MRWIRFILGGIALLALLAGVAYVGARLATRSVLPAAAGGVAPALQAGASGSEAVKGGSVALTPAPQLPQAPPDERSLFVRRIGATVYVSMPTVEGFAREYDIVTAATTVVYRDTTALSAAPDNQRAVQQTLVPGRLDDIGEGAMVSAWGSRNCDRLYATTLVYRPAQALNARP